MAQFIAFNKDVEVNGETVLSVVAGMETYKSAALEILKRNGIDDPKPGKWYSQQAWLDAFKNISDQIGSATLTRIGRAIPDNAQWPKGINTIVDALSSIDVAYHMNHRLDGKVMFDTKTGKMTEGIGHYAVESAEDRKLVMVCNNPYPCNFDKGIIMATASKFAPKNTFVAVKEESSTACRKNKSNSCTYLLTW